MAMKCSRNDIAAIIVVASRVRTRLESTKPELRTQPRRGRGDELKQERRVADGHLASGVLTEPYGVRAGAAPRARRRRSATSRSPRRKPPVLSSRRASSGSTRPRRPRRGMNRGSARAATTNCAFSLVPIVTCSRWRRPARRRHGQPTNPTATSGSRRRDRRIFAVICPARCEGTGFAARSSVIWSNRGAPPARGWSIRQSERRTAPRRREDIAACLSDPVRAEPRALDGVARCHGLQRGRHGARSRPPGRIGCNERAHRAELAARGAVVALGRSPRARLAAGCARQGSRRHTAPGAESGAAPPPGATDSAR
jgi:hypothetical protein